MAEADGGGGEEEDDNEGRNTSGWSKKRRRGGWSGMKGKSWNSNGGMLLRDTHRLGTGFSA